jgi:cardiolipin synthase
MQPVTNLLIHLGWDLTWWTVLLAVSELFALATVPSVLIQRRGQPLSAISWTLALVGMPFLGVLSWWLIGRSHLERKRRKKVRARWAISRGFASFRPEAEREEGESPFQAFKVMPEQEAAGVFPSVSGNRVTVLVDGRETYDAMERAIRSATHHVNALFYIWQPDATGRRFRDLLCEKAREGVRVRVLLDAFGSGKATGKFMDPLREAGGRVGIFMPTRFLRRSLAINFRNHRKILVADGCAAYTGGLNVGDEYTRDWRDVGLLLHGPVVSQLQEVFLEDWYFATGEDLAEKEFLPWCGVPDGVGEAGSDARCAVVASGPDTLYNATQDAFFLAFTLARKRIWITTPYLIPDSATQTALRTAVYRGVDVRLLVPARSDSAVTRLAGRSFYPSLLSGGIRIFEYKPAVLHGKSWVFDDEWAAIGTANMDTRSFRLNFEVSCFLQGREVNARLASLYARDLEASEEVTLQQLAQAGPIQQFKEAAMNLLSPLL